MNEKVLYDSASLAEQIKSRAKAQGIQIKVMLETLGLNKNTLSDLRAGKRLSFDSLARIADYLDCSMDFLAGRTANPSVQWMDLTDEERQKVQDYVQFILSQRK